MERIRVFGDRQFCLIGQIAYDRGSACASPDAALHSAGIRLYAGVDARDERAQFLCVG
jgi:hypothetical protein